MSESPERLLQLESRRTQSLARCDTLLAPGISCRCGCSSAEVLTAPLPRPPPPLAACRARCWPSHRCAASRSDPTVCHPTASHDCRGAGDARQAGQQGAAQEGGCARHRLAHRKGRGGGGPGHLTAGIRASVSEGCCVPVLTAGARASVREHCRALVGRVVLHACCTTTAMRSWLVKQRQSASVPNPDHILHLAHTHMCTGRRSSTCWRRSTAWPASTGWQAPARPARRGGPQPAAALDRLTVGRLASGCPQRAPADAVLICTMMNCTRPKHSLTFAAAGSFAPDFSSTPDEVQRLM